MLPEIWARTNEMVAHRRDRRHTSQSEVPGTLWMVVLPRTTFNAVMIAALAFSLGLVFFFIVAMDRPFAGRESISPGPFQSALDNMQRWDETSR